MIFDISKIPSLKFISGPQCWCTAGGLDMVMAATKAMGGPALVVESTGSYITVDVVTITYTNYTNYKLHFFG